MLIHSLNVLIISLHSNIQASENFNLLFFLLTVKYRGKKGSQIISSPLTAYKIYECSMKNLVVNDRRNIAKGLARKKNLVIMTNSDELKKKVVVYKIYKNYFNFKNAEMQKWDTYLRILK